MLVIAPGARTVRAGPGVWSGSRIGRAGQSAAARAFGADYIANILRQEALAVVRPVLLDIQRGQCFYCHAPLTPVATHVDHFIAWARYPVDLGHNFVLADKKCNSQKRDRLPACDHLAAWAERNTQCGAEITSELERRGVIAELASSNRVTRWAYSQTERAGGLTWLRADEMVPLPATWRDLIHP